MRVICVVLIVSTTALAACSGWRDSGVNPRNWFGSSRSDPVPVQTAGVPISPSDRQTGNPLIADEDASVLVNRRTTTITQNSVFRRRNREVVYVGTLVDQVTSLSVEAIPTGAIIRVTGEPIREGAFDVRLLRTNPDGPVNGVMEYTLNAYQPADFGRGTQSTREVEAGAFLDNAELEQVKEIRIRGVRNVRSVKR